MKIIILQDYLRNGGTERQSVLLANAFAAAGQPTTLLTCRPGGAISGTVDAAVTRAVLQPVDTHQSWFAPGLVRFAAQLHPDVVLCMGRMANCYAGRLQDRLPDTAVVATLRTGKKLPWLYRRSLRTVRHIIANSQASARHLIAGHAIPAQKITVIHNALVFIADSGFSMQGCERPPGVEHPLPRSRSKPSGLAVRAQSAAGPDTVVLLCVAMFRPEKNHQGLLDIAAQLPGDCNWQLWLAGDGETRPACLALAHRLGLADRVKFLGFHPNPTPLYEAADIVVLASHAESLPNCLIEAQAHGLPVVAYDVGGVRECFIPGTTGWAVPIGNATGFAEAVAALFADGTGRDAIAPVARAFAEDTFAPTNQIRRYLDLFTQL